MGSITFRKKRNTYYYRYRIKVDGTWKEQSINLDTDSYSAALKLKEQYDQQITQGKSLKSQMNSTLADYMSSLIEQKKYHKIGTASVAMYKSITSQLLETDLAIIPIKKIKSQDIEHLLRGLDFSYSHLHKWHITIKQLFDMAVRDGVIIRNPALDVKITWVKQNTRKRVFTMNELKRIFAEADEHDSKYGTEFGKLYRLYYYTGARRTELIHFHRDWYVRDRSLILIPANESKSARITPKFLNSEARSLIEWYLEKYPEFDMPILRDRSPRWYPGTITNHFRRMMKNLGIRGASLHTFRHTFASYLSADPDVGISNVKDLAGHQDIRTTMGYSHPMEQRLKELVERLPVIDLD